jgi:hypothetical protein
LGILAIREIFVVLLMRVQRNDFINSPIFECSNIKSAGNAAVPDGSALATNPTFHIYSPQVWSKYPQALRDRYADAPYTEVADGEGRQIFVTEEFCCTILDERIIFKELKRKLSEVLWRLIGKRGERFVPTKRSLTWKEKQTSQTKKPG